ncbi:MAG: ubiquitin-like small modifier protein 1 [Deltaproteobacteria bacterium]
MKITLRTFADFREIIGIREKEISLPDGETVGGLLKGLCKTHPTLQEKLFDAGAKLKPYVIILKNGRNIASLHHIDTVIEDGDVIALFPPVAGG